MVDFSKLKAEIRSEIDKWQKVLTALDDQSAEEVFAGKHEGLDHAGQGVDSGTRDGSCELGRCTNEPGNTCSPPPVFIGMLSFREKVQKAAKSRWDREK
jgi:hypothetical protein